MTKPAVLILEDSDIALNALTRALLSLDIEVVICTTPENGFLTLNEVRLFDFVISDGEGWRECYLKAVELYGKEKLIIYSGHHQALQDAARLDLLFIDKGIFLKESAEFLREVLESMLPKMP